jgi:hypothetical protein
MTKEQAQKRMYDIKDERNFLDLLEDEIDRRQKALLAEARGLLSDFPTLSLMTRLVPKS